MIRRMHVSEFVECVSHAADTIGPNGNVARCALAARSAPVSMCSCSVGRSERRGGNNLAIRSEEVEFFSALILSAAAPHRRTGAPRAPHSAASLCAARYCITYARASLLYTPNDRKVKQNIAVELMEEV